MNYINIHTHRLAGEFPNTEKPIAIQNIIIGRDEIPTEGFFSAGIHPWYINQDFNEQFLILEKVSESGNCLMIGECGLDKLSETDPALQEQLFRMQVALAKKLNKPLIIHCVKKFTEVKHLLKEEKFTNSFILHGINTKPENIKPFLNIAGAFFSFGPALLHKNSNAEKIFSSLPLEKCFLETDDKDSDIKKMYLRAAEIHNIQPEVLAAQIENNFSKLISNAD